MAVYLTYCLKMVFSVDYSVKFSAQLKEQLRSLRKARSLSQSDLGVLVGVNQRRIADIESNPGAVGLDQIMKILSALGAEILIRDLANPPVIRTASLSRAPAPEPYESPVHLLASARHLLAVLHTGGPFAPEAYLWNESVPHDGGAFPPKSRRQLVERLAREMVRNPVVLDVNLKQAASQNKGVGKSDVPTPVIQQQWAQALGVDPADLKWAVDKTRMERTAPAGLDRPASKGAW